MQVNPAGAASTIASPFDLFERALAKLASEGTATVLSLPTALGDAATVLGRLRHLDPTSLLQTLVVVVAIIGVHMTVSRLTATRRALAARHPLPFVALLKQTAWDVLALVAAGVTGRVLIARWLDLPPGAPVLPADMAVALVRWLFGMTIVRFFFQPEAPALRLVRVDDAGARRAILWAQGLFAFGHAHAVLLALALRHGLSAGSARALTILAALLMLAAGIRLFSTLRRHGIGRLAGNAGVIVSALLGGLWIWGAMAGEANLFRGALGSISIIVLAWVLDQIIALSIRASRRPQEMRRLFVIRVVVGTTAIALTLRVLIDFWFAAYPGLFGSQGWSQISSRFTFASALMVGGAWLCAAIHVWTEAKLAPPEGETLSADEASLRSRLSTVLPIIRFGLIAAILLVVSLMALSILGIDITPLMAGAGILGLAISLGSQTLVKDIVSGLFYMVDDVFRLGETIESNNRRGRLENISTRSVRLRDDDGRVHTIPFGDLGTITNHSRRLVTVDVTVDFAAAPGRVRLAAFTRAIGAALRSEPLLQGGIVGAIATTVETRDPEGEDDRVLVSFVIDAGRSRQAEQVAPRLISSELADAGFGRSEATVSAAIREIAPATPANPSTTSPLATPAKIG